MTVFYLHYSIYLTFFHFLMFPVFLFPHLTGHISSIYVPRFSLSSPDRAHICFLCDPFPILLN
jgi:hypothetical protein